MCFNCGVCRMFDLNWPFMVIDTLNFHVYFNKLSKHGILPQTNHLWMSTCIVCLCLRACWLYHKHDCYCGNTILSACTVLLSCPYKYDYNYLVCICSAGLYVWSCQFVYTCICTYGLLLYCHTTSPCQSCSYICSSLSIMLLAQTMHAIQTTSYCSTYVHVYSHWQCSVHTLWNYCYVCLLIACSLALHTLLVAI